MDLPIIICNHRYEVSGDDRDRSLLDIYDSNCAIREVLRKVSADEALVLLEICKPRWRNTYGRDWKGRNWYTMLEILIDKVTSETDVKRRFLERYENELVTMDLWWMNPYRKKMALVWYRQSRYYETTRVVSDLFEKFDVPSVGMLCREHNGFDEEAAPDEVQKKYIRILERIVNTYFADLICYERLPECRILLNKEAPILGKAHSIKEDKRIVNTYGHVVKTRISNVYIQSHLFKSDMFEEALSVYLHELLHQFGGDSSRQFQGVLVQMNRIIVANMQEINAFIRDWRAVENGAN